LLGALPEEDLDNTLKNCEIAKLEEGRRLYREGGPVDSVYFPTGGVVSVLAGTDDGDVEVASIGNEGVAGVNAAMGVPQALGRTVIQVAGDGIVMGTKQFQKLLKEGRQLSTLVHRYCYAFVRQIMQGCACNRLHNPEERCARWLLMTHDRAGTDQFTLTQNFLAQMMGTRRASVNLALALFRRAGAIQYVYRRIEVLDRKQLESFACPCYGIIRRSYDLVKI
jgi:CRP-like cAMP-binding protein